MRAFSSALKRRRVLLVSPFSVSIRGTIANPATPRLVDFAYADTNDLSFVISLAVRALSVIQSSSSLQSAKWRMLGRSHFVLSASRIFRFALERIALVISASKRCVSEQPSSASNPEAPIKAKSARIPTLKMSRSHNYCAGTLLVGNPKRTTRIDYCDDRTK
jgi:hypothetical protein